MNNRIFILAETYAHYMNWLRNNVIGLKGFEFTFVRNVTQILGQNELQFIIIDGFHRREDAAEILREVEYRSKLKG